MLDKRRCWFAIMTLITVLAFIGCSSDDGTTPPVPEAIVGSWEQVYDDDVHYYKITFNEDGTGSEIAMFEGVVTNQAVFDYEVSGNTYTIDFGDGDVFTGTFSIDGDTLTVNMGGDTVEFVRVTDTAGGDIEGTWTLTATVVESTCGGFPGEAETFCVTITRSGQTVTLVVGEETITGTMTSNSTAYFDRSGNGCTVDLILTVSADGGFLSGSNPMVCPGEEGCSESSTISGVRSGGC